MKLKVVGEAGYQAPQYPNGLAISFLTRIKDRNIQSKSSFVINTLLSKNRGGINKLEDLKADFLDPRGPAKYQA